MTAQPTAEALHGRDRAAAAPSGLRSMILRLLLAPAFGLALGGVFAAVWLALERAWTPKSWAALAVIVAAAALAGLVADIAMRRLRLSAAPARFAAALVVLLAGIVVFASLGLFAEAILAAGGLPPLPPGHLVRYAAILLAVQAYGFVVTAAPLVLVPGLPLIVLYAAILARRPR